MLDNIKLYDYKGYPITIKYVCGKCKREMLMPYVIVHDASTGEERYYCENCRVYAIRKEKYNEG